MLISASASERFFIDYIEHGENTFPPTSVGLSEATVLSFLFKEKI